jgi:hypothetical protein
LLERHEEEGPFPAEMRSTYVFRESRHAAARAIEKMTTE